MKTFKRIIALCLAVLMTLSLSACIHKKNEIAVTVDSIEFTSAYYMCSLINAKLEAETKVYADLSAEEQTSEIDYFSKKVDDMSFTDWVEDRAIESLKEIAAYKILCKENDLELTDEQKSEAEQMLSYYWDSYGYSTYFEPNGVSRETYGKYVEDAYYAELYFDFLYGKEGTKAVSTEDVNKEITESYILADVISVTYDTDADDTAKASDKAVLEDYASQIKSGKSTFIDVYKSYYGIEDTTETEETAETEETEETDEVEPINTYATILGADDTSFASDDYATYKGYEIDVAQVVEDSDKTQASLVIKRDITKDQYFMDYLDSYARHSIKDEEFESEIEAYAENLKANVNRYAVSQFKVKKIVEP